MKLEALSPIELAEDRPSNSEVTLELIQACINRSAERVDEDLFALESEHSQTPVVRRGFITDQVKSHFKEERQSFISTNEANLIARGQHRRYKAVIVNATLLDVERK